MAHESRYWAIRRRSVVPAFALGLFFAWLPFPGHPFWAAFAALMARANIPVAAMVTFVTNPLTMGPMYFTAFQLGSALLGSEERAFEFELSLDWVTHQFVTIWQPLTIGCLLLGTLSAVVGYVVLDVLWRFSLRDYKHRRRGNGNNR